MVIGPIHLSYSVNNPKLRKPFQVLIDQDNGCFLRTTSAASVGKEIVETNLLHCNFAIFDPHWYFLRSQFLVLDSRADRRTDGIEGVASGHWEGGEGH